MQYKELVFFSKVTANVTANFWILFSDIYIFLKYSYSLCFCRFSTILLDITKMPFS